MATPTVTEIMATTLVNRERAIGDAVLKHQPLTYILLEKGRVKPVKGGRKIYEPLYLVENDTVKWYNGYDTFTIGQPPEQIHAAEYPWCQLGGFAAISGAEKVQNREKWQSVDLAESRIENLQKTLENQMGGDIYTNGMTGVEIQPLDFLIQDDPTSAGTPGGIDQADANYANWRNQTNGGSAITDIQAEMNDMYLSTTRGTDQTDLICGDRQWFATYWASLQQIQRIGSARLGEAGFRTVKFVGADCVYDARCPDGGGASNKMRAYFINSDYFTLRCAPDRRFSVGKTRLIQDADYEVTPVWFMGQLTCNDRARQGVMYDGT